MNRYQYNWNYNGKVQYIMIFIINGKQVEIRNSGIGLLRLIEFRKESVSRHSKSNK